VDGDTTGLGVDLDEGAAILGRREEGSAVGDGARRCMAQRGLEERAWHCTAWQVPTEGLRPGLVEGARLRWQRGDEWGR
jgi:hypothetical protein